MTGCTDQTFKAGDCLAVHSWRDVPGEPWDGRVTVRVEMVGKKEYLVKEWQKVINEWESRESTIPINPETVYYERRPCPRKD